MSAVAETLAFFVVTVVFPRATLQRCFSESATHDGERLTSPSTTSANRQESKPPLYELEVPFSRTSFTPHGFSTSPSKTSSNVFFDFLCCVVCQACSNTLPMITRSVFQAGKDVADDIAESYLQTLGEASLE